MARGKLPGGAALRKRSTKAIVATLRRAGVKVDVKRLESTLARGLVQLTIAPSPSAPLIARARQTVTRAAQREALRELKSYVRGQNRSALGLVGIGGAEEKAVWIAVLDKATCDDCLSRHGVAKTMAEWEAEGLPGSDNLICDGNCRCDFLRGDMVDERTTEDDIRVSLDLEVESDAAGD